MGWTDEYPDFVDRYFGNKIGASQPAAGVLSKYEASAIRKSSGHNDKCPERSKYPALMTYLAGEPDPAKWRTAGRLIACALGYRYPSDVEEMMARQ